MIDLKQARRDVVGTDKQGFNAIPKHNCQKCRDTSWIVDEEKSVVSRCECWKQKIKDKKIRILGQFSRFNFSNYQARRYKQPDGSVKTLPDAMKDLQGSYFLAGNYREGKTHLLAAQYLALTEAGFYSTSFVREVDLIAGLQREVYGRLDESAQYIPKYLPRHFQDKEYYHFFVDDLGKTPVTPDRQYQLFSFFDMIYYKGFGLTISSNYTLDQLEKRWNSEYAGAIIRRIEDICQPIYMFEVI